MAVSSIITVTPIQTPKYIQATVIKVEIAWTTDGSGNFTTIDVDDDTYGIAKDLVGRVCTMGLTDPDGTAIPTPSYDIEILDEYGIDIFGGALNDRHTSNSEQTVPIIAPNTYGSRLITGDLQFALANAGNSKQGKCVLLFEYR